MPVGADVADGVTNSVERNDVAKGVAGSAIWPKGDITGGVTDDGVTVRGVPRDGVITRSGRGINRERLSRRPGKRAAAESHAAHDKRRTEDPIDDCG